MESPPTDHVQSDHVQPTSNDKPSTTTATTTTTTNLTRSQNAGGVLTTPTPSGFTGNEFDYLFKILIIGNSNVGKTCFLFRYTDDSFSPSFVSTVGIDFKVKTVVRNGKRIKLQIWDTAGQERFRSITTSYYRGALGFLLVYDVSKEESFTSVRDWITRIRTYAWENAQIVLIGNKSDVADSDREVAYQDGGDLGSEIDVPFFEVSAKLGTHVTAAFETLVDAIVIKWTKTIEEEVVKEAQQRLDTLLNGGSHGFSSFAPSNSNQKQLENGDEKQMNIKVGHSDSAKRAASCLC